MANFSLRVAISCAEMGVQEHGVTKTTEEPIRLNKRIIFDS